MVEIIVPYGDPRSPFQHKCAFDVMDYGLGATANSLELGCDCLGHIKYFDGMVNNSKGACCVSFAITCKVGRSCAWQGMSCKGVSVRQSGFGCSHSGFLKRLSGNA